MKLRMFLIALVVTIAACQMNPAQLIVINQLDHRVKVGTYLWLNVVEAGQSVTFSLPQGLRTVLTATDGNKDWGPFDVYVPSGNTMIFRIGGIGQPHVKTQ